MGKHILLFIVFIACAGITLASGDPRKLVFYSEDYPPFNFEQDGRVTGLNAELLRAVADDLNLDVTFLEVPWTRAQSWTQTQENACFYSAVRTVARESLYQWAGPLSIERITLFSASESLGPLPSMADAVGYNIGGRSQDAYTQFVQQQGLEVDVVSSSGVNLEKLIRGRIDLWIAGSIGGPYIAAQEGISIYPVVKSEETVPFWLGCNLDLDPELVNKISQAIESFRSSDLLESLLESYR